MRASGLQQLLDEAELIARTRDAGDTQAWRSLVERYHKLIWSVVRKFSLSNDETADVCNTTWLPSGTQHHPGSSHQCPKASRGPGARRAGRGAAGSRVASRPCPRWPGVTTDPSGPLPVFLSDDPDDQAGADAFKRLVEHAAAVYGTTLQLGPHQDNSLLAMQAALGRAARGLAAAALLRISTDRLLDLDGRQADYLGDLAQGLDLETIEALTWAFTDPGETP